MRKDESAARHYMKKAFVRKLFRFLFCRFLYFLPTLSDSRIRSIIAKDPKYRFPAKIDFQRCRENIAAYLNEYCNRWCN